MAALEAQVKIEFQASLQYILMGAHFDQVIWYSGTMVQWYNGTMVQLYKDTATVDLYK